MVTCGDKWPALEQYLLTVLVVLLYACIVLCIMYMTI